MGEKGEIDLIHHLPLLSPHSPPNLSLPSRAVVGGNDPHSQPLSISLSLSLCRVGPREARGGRRGSAAGRARRWRAGGAAAAAERRACAVAAPAAARGGCSLGQQLPAAAAAAVAACCCGSSCCCSQRQQPAAAAGTARNRRRAARRGGRRSTDEVRESPCFRFNICFKLKSLDIHSCSIYKFLSFVWMENPFDRVIENGVMVWIWNLSSHCHDLQEKF